MNSGEEAEHIWLAQQGSTEAMNALFLNHLPWVVRCCRRLLRPGDGKLAECINESFFGFCTAVKKYDSSKGCKFITYVSYWIDRCVLNFLSNDHLIRVPRGTMCQYIQGKANGRARYVSAALQVGSLDDLVNPSSESEHDLLEVSDELQAIKRRSVMLTKREWEVIEHHLNGETYQDIGESMGVSSQRVHQIYTRAMQHLRGQGFRNAQSRIQ
jgi:RNA polymerase sigma factor (sigma-70 family)